MITFKQFLAEAANYPLYHGTSAWALIKILESNVLETGFHQDPYLHWPSKQGKIVSLTRSLSFAKNWRGGQGIVIELNRRKLANNYKIVPFNFFGDRFGFGGNRARWNHSERFHPDFMDLDRNQYEEVTIKPIKNVVSYMNKVYISDHVKPSLQQQIIDSLKSKNIKYEIYNK